MKKRVACLIILLSLILPCAVCTLMNIILSGGLYMTGK